MRMPEPTVRERAERASLEAYNAVLLGLNRAQRRTAKGRLIEAKARIAALEAENKVLREAQGDCDA